MGVLEIHGGEKTSGYLFECVGGLFNLSSMLLSDGDANNDSYHQIIYGLVKLYVHEESLYYHATSEIYFYNSFKRVTQLLIHTG